MSESKDLHGSAPDKSATALYKKRANDVVSSSVEMVLFELMKDAEHEQFKEIQKLIK